MNGTTANRVTLYRERHDFPLAAKEPSPRNYLALYETDLQDAQQPEELKEKVCCPGERIVLGEAN